MKTQKCLSPTKENVSPSKLSLRACDNLSEFIDLVKAAGLKIPIQLEKSLLQANGNKSLLKITSTVNTSEDQIKKIKLKLGDTQFELKKLEEDFAQYKLVSRQEKERQIKKWEESYLKIKSNLEQSSQDSSIKLLRLRENHENQMKTNKEKHSAEIKQQTQKLTTYYEDKLSSHQKITSREIIQLKDRHQKQTSKLVQRYSSDIQELKTQHEFQVRKQALKNKDNIQFKQKQFESIYTALQSEKKTEQKLHQKTKIQASQAKEKLYAEIYLERNLKKVLEEDIEKLTKQIRGFKSTIHDLGVTIHLQKQKAAKREKSLLSDFEVQKIGSEQLFSQKNASILSAHSKQLQKYEERIQQLGQWKNNLESLMDENMVEVQKKFGQRLSRKEDLDIIEKLKSRLHRKQDEVRILNKQLRACVLEIENKQETYNKIFTSHTVNKLEKRSLAKDRQEFKSRDSLNRKSQTTDIKFLLKVYNKHI